MKIMTRLALGLMLAVEAASTAHASPSYSMDCSKPLYVPAAAGSDITSALLGKGISMLIPLAEQAKAEEDIAEGGVVLSSLDASVRGPVGKYFGPFQWQEYKCMITVTFVQKFGNSFGIVYTNKGENSANRITSDPNEKVEPCTGAILKALAGLSCKGRSNGSSNESGGN